MSVIEDMQRRLNGLTPIERERMRRLVSGEADGDLLTRAAVVGIIRDLRTSPASLSSQSYQRALHDVQIAIGRMVGLQSPLPTQTGEG
ncbi:hypothetical protein [Sphingomonas sp. 1P08PE]|uniref:hypothetical protein n=1 Tax=Sphingomonas sp. 1P08PE TaxID=554122 RepID=UPI0039A1E5C4